MYYFRQYKTSIKSIQLRIQYFELKIDIDMLKMKADQLQ